MTWTRIIEMKSKMNLSQPTFVHDDPDDLDSLLNLRAFDKHPNDATSRHKIKVCTHEYPHLDDIFLFMSSIISDVLSNEHPYNSTNRRMHEVCPQVAAQ